MTQRVRGLLLNAIKNKTFLNVLWAFSFALLIASSCYISYRSAQVNTYNHDQLIDSYLFASSPVFHAASFPSAHTFFVKWPLFAAMAATGNHEQTYFVATLLLYLATVSIFALVLTHICKNNRLLAATLILALTSVLMLVPAQSHPGVLAPVNMAMVTTRNIEYLLFFVYIFILIKVSRLASRRTLLAVAVLTLLGLSDHLFLLFALIAAAIDASYKLYAKIQTEKNVLIPMAISGISYVLVTLASIAINVLHVTTIFEPTKSAPFNIIASVWQGFTSFAWALQALAVNYGIDIFGKDPSAKLLPYVINAGVFFVAALAAYRLYIRRSDARQLFAEADSHIFGYWLYLTSLAAIIVYVISDHILENDLRYLGIALFAGFVAIAVYFTKKDQEPKPVALLSAYICILLVIPLTVLDARAGLRTDLYATQQLYASRTTAITQSISRLGISVLVGDYWVVSPVKLRVGDSLTMAPLITEACNVPNYYLTSKAWYEPANGNTPVKSALFVKLDGDKKTVNHGCSSESLTSKFGKPATTIPLNDEPGESLQVYNYDIRKVL